MNQTPKSPTVRVLVGDVREQLRNIPDGTVHCCVTSPPYWGLRDYGTAQWEGGDAGCDHRKAWERRQIPHGDRPSETDPYALERVAIPGAGRMFKDTCGKCGAKRIDRQIGQEPTPEAFVATMVDVFREVRRCLHKSGTCWLNLGDGFKDKQLQLMPFRVALALQQDGWYVRSVICWHKKSCLPESVTDRPTNSWEPIFLLAKNSRYFYDAEAVKEPVADCSMERATYSFESSKNRNNIARGGNESFNGKQLVPESGIRNLRNVWSLGPEPLKEDHYASFPTAIPRRAILAGTSAKGCCPKCYAPWVRKIERESMTQEMKDEWAKARQRTATDHGRTDGFTTRKPNFNLETSTVGWEPGCECKVCVSCKQDTWECDCIKAGGYRVTPDPIPCTVLDHFAGSGTTGAVALELGRHAVLIELNPKYAKLIDRRLAVTPGLPLAI